MRVAICRKTEQKDDHIQNCMEMYKDKDKEITFSFQQAEQLAHEYISGKKYNIIIIEIIMNEVNELEIVKLIRSIDKYVSIIFICSNYKYIQEAFRLGIFQYFTKPVNNYEFCLEFQRALECYQYDHVRFVVKDKEEIVVLEVNEIVYIEGYMRQVTFVTYMGDKYSVKGKIKDQEIKLLSRGFVRTHQGFIVNMSYIKEIDCDELITCNGIRIPMSVRRKQRVIREFNKFIAKEFI
ncbi:MAG: lytT [Clostridiales bacterium]|jgi:DNA-binding LytR/AlgR family response regulator|nr:lytT [Clostridiales bacterium]